MPRSISIRLRSLFQLCAPITMGVALLGGTIHAQEAPSFGEPGQVSLTTHVGDLDDTDWAAGVGDEIALAACTSCDNFECTCSGNTKHGKKLRKRLRKDQCKPVDPWWAHRTGGFGEFLFLRPGSSDLIYAVEQTDTTATASPTGPIGTTDLDAETGFRVGFTLASSQKSSLVVAFARWDGDTDSVLNANGTNVLNSQVIHPSTATTGAASVQAAASHNINFQTLDLAYRKLWRRTDTMALNWVAGVRYGNMEQQLSVDQTVAVATGLTNVTTDIDFDGFGITGGLDFESYSCTTGISLYGKVLASLLAGEWNATFQQTNQFGGGVIANEYEDFHLSPVLEAELGLRWTSPKRRLQLSTGFLVSSWYEAVTTRSYLDAFRAGQLTDVGETQTFSGLTAGATWRF